MERAAPGRGLAHYTPDAGYRFPTMVADRPDPADELFVCVSLSGGGTRAAALTYGALLLVLMRWAPHGLLGDASLLGRTLARRRA